MSKKHHLESACGPRPRRLSRRSAARRVGRWLYVASLAAGSGLIAGWLSTPAWSQVLFTRPSQAVTQQRPLTLKDLLAKELKARRPQEFAFIDQVVQMVEQKQLPIKLVRASLLWSRNKRPYPMIYFEQSLRRQAARAGIIIPK